MGLHRLLAIQCPTSRTWTRADHSTRHGGRIGGGTLLSVCLAHNVPDTPAAAGVCAAPSHSARHRVSPPAKRCAGSCRDGVARSTPTRSALLCRQLEPQQTPEPYAFIDETARQNP
jgi:hypothetical protein